MRGHKKTQEEFVQEVYELVGDKYEVLGEYVNARTKIKFLHKECDHIYKATPHTFLQGSRCPKCFGSKKKTQEEFEQEVYDKVKDEYTVIGEYQNNRTKIKMRHESCEKAYMARPDHFLIDGRRCPYCNGTASPEVLINGKSQQQFEREVKEDGNGEYEVLGEYVRAKTKVKLKHKECGHTWKVTPTSFLYHGTRCPKCAHKKTHEEFVEEIEEKYGNEYRVLGKYISSREKIKVKHTTCGTIWDVNPSSILSSSCCPTCGREKADQKRTKTHDEFVNDVYNQVDDEYSVVGHYDEVLKPIKMRHNICGFEWKILPNNFLSVGNRCPKCADQIYSQGEKRVGEFLEKNNIEYERQYSLDGCKHKKKLRFDFAIFERSDNDILFDRYINKVIEYNGKQHYESVEHFGGKEKYEERKKRDKIKRDYCDKYNIPMLVISYKNKDKIRDILTKKILKK